MSTKAAILESRPWRRLALALVALCAVAGCGQRGPLYLPTDPAAAGRATLPQILNPMRSSPPPAAVPASAARAAPQARPPADDQPLFGPDTGSANPVRTP